MVIVHTFLLCSFVFVVKFILHEVRMNVFIFFFPVALESIIHRYTKNHPRVKRVVVHKGYNPMLLADAYNV